MYPTFDTGQEGISPNIRTTNLTIMVGSNSSITTVLKYSKDLCDADPSMGDVGSCCCWLRIVKMYFRDGQKCVTSKWLVGCSRRVCEVYDRVVQAQVGGNVRYVDDITLIVRSQCR